MSHELTKSVEKITLPLSRIDNTTAQKGSESDAAFKRLSTTTACFELLPNKGIQETSKQTHNGRGLMILQRTVSVSVTLTHIAPVP